MGAATTSCQNVWILLVLVKALLTSAVHAQQQVTIGLSGRLHTKEGEEYVATVTSINNPNDNDAIQKLVFDWGDGSAPTAVTLAALRTQNHQVTHVYDDGPRSLMLLTVTAETAGGTVVAGSLFVTVQNVSPTAAGFVNTGPAAGVLGSVVSFIDARDPSVADAVAGLRYAYDLDGNGLFDDDGAGNGLYAGSVTNSSMAVPASLLRVEFPWTHTVRGRVLDKDGGYTDYTTVIDIVKPSPVPPTTAPSPTSINRCTCPQASSAWFWLDPVLMAPPYYRLHGDIVGTCPVAGSELCQVDRLTESSVKAGDVFTCVTAETKQTVSFQVFNNVTETQPPSVLDFGVADESCSCSWRMTSIHLEGAPPPVHPFGSATQLPNYALVGTSNEAPAIDLANGGVLGAGIFDASGTAVPTSWENASCTCGASRMEAGVTWTGDIALTAAKSRISVAGGNSTTAIYGNVGIVGQNVKTRAISRAAQFFGQSRSGSVRLRRDGVISGATVEMLTLRSELYALEAFWTNLPTELSLQMSGIENDWQELCIDAHDINGDGLVVIDIDPGEGNDFVLTNSHWIIESEQQPSKFAVIRIVGDHGFVAVNSGILLGDGVCGNAAAHCNSNQSSASPPLGIGAAIVRATRYRGASGQRIKGVKTRTELFTLNHVVVNGIGFYDLVKTRNNPDKGNTVTRVQDIQGCTQLVGSVLGLSNHKLWKCPTGWRYAFNDENGSGGCTASVKAAGNQPIGSLAICVSNRTQ